MKKHTLTLIAVFAFLLSACGDSKDTNNDPESNFTSGNCGAVVVSNYNDMARACRSYANDNGIVIDRTNSCLTKAEAFKAQYPGIHCTAVVSKSTSTDPQQYQVTMAEINELIVAAKALEALRSQPQD